MKQSGSATTKIISESPQRKPRQQTFSSVFEQTKIEEEIIASVNERMTPVGEIVYLRSVLQFNELKKESRRDTVLEANLLDVKRLLKTSAFPSQK